MTVADPKIDAWIDRSAVGVAEARIAGGPHVWALVGYFVDAAGRPTHRYLDDAAVDYHLPREAIDAAFTFYCTHRAVLDARAAANAA